MALKICIHCKLPKDQSAFYFRSDRGQYYTMCRTCRSAPRTAKYHSDPEFRAENKRKAVAWAKRNPDKTKGINARASKKRKLAALAAYGGKCQCCGENRISMLDIDHIHNDGYRHRKEIGRRSMYSVVAELGFPKDRFQLLCCNCNHSKRRNKKVCEHVTEDLSALFGLCHG